MRRESTLTGTERSLGRAGQSAQQQDGAGSPAPPGESRQRIARPDWAARSGRLTRQTTGGPLTAGVFTYNPKLPAYDLVNLRAGVRRNTWDIAFFINNLFDELALLSFDQERGTRARVGFLTNQPRTFGISTRLDF